ncbi:MAG: uroporphyrinogen decarboxylase family protein [Planctomycetota bacterium]
MNSRERVRRALEHAEPDRIPLDLGATPVTGMHVQSVYRLRQGLGLDPPGTPVKIVEPYQNLGEIAPDLAEALGVDVVGVGSPRTMFGFPNEDWREWRAFDDTPVLVPAGYNTDPEPNGSVLMHPAGDRTAPPSGRMPAGGYYFDAIVRQPPLDEAKLRVEDNLEEFGPLSAADLAHFRREVARIRATTDRAIVANFGGTAFGDIALVPAPWLKHPRGIRDIEEWYVSTVSRREHVREIFARQCEIALANLERAHAAVGEDIDAVFLTGTDFGTQRGPFLSPRAFRDLYLPFQKRLNDWVHAHTTWKTFIHSCGSVAALLPEFVAAGFDILNPVQWTAAEMDLAALKERFGDRLTFWGGGVDTQRTLSFATPAEVRAQVRECIALLGRNGGFVFNTIHNVQPRVPPENLLALYEAVQDHRGL